MRGNLTTDGHGWTRIFFVVVVLVLAIEKFEDEGENEERGTRRINFSYAGR
jgi:hypothetical protein